MTQPLNFLPRAFRAFLRVAPQDTQQELSELNSGVDQVARDMGEGSLTLALRQVRQAGGEARCTDKKQERKAGRDRSVEGRGKEREGKGGLWGGGRGRGLEMLSLWQVRAEQLSHMKRKAQRAGGVEDWGTRAPFSC